MLNNTRYLHIMLGEDCAARMKPLNAHLLKRKYPGEHVAIVRAEDAAAISRQDIFHEVHAIDCAFMQRCAFSPLLGDGIAFNVLWETVYPLTQMTWTKIFNLGNNPAETAVASLFGATPVLGAELRDGQTLCSDSPLKLSRLLSDWKMSHPVIRAILQRKTLQQLDLASLEKKFLTISEIKSQNTNSGLKSALVGVRIADFSNVDGSTLEFLAQLFTLIALDAHTAQELTGFGIAFNHWKDTSIEDHLFLDLIIQDCDGDENFWEQSLNVAEKSAEELTDRLAEILPANFAKWVCLSFMFDYLGQPKLALQSEKILTRYDRQALQPFLYQEVLNLKDFAKTLLEGLRRQGTSHHNILQDYWSTRPGVLSFVCAIELSLTPTLVPMFRNDQDVMAVKTRLRQLNSLYERVHRACTLDLPKTDLALTL